MMQGFRSRGFHGVAGLLLATVPFAALASDQDARVIERERPAATCGCPAAPIGVKPASLTAEQADAGLADALAARLCADAVALPKGASADDLEAAMVFAISQSNAKPEVIRAALDILSGCDHGQSNFLAALGRVRESLADRTLRRGTAALSGTSAFNSTFTSPSVNLAGGSSDYTR